MNWIQSSERLIDLLARTDMQNQSVYLIPFEWVAEHEPRLRGGSCAAWTSPLADLLLHQWLSSRGRWHGRGFATILHCDHLTKLQDFIGAVLHELAHYLTMRIPPALSVHELDHTSKTVLSWVPLQWAENSPVPVDSNAIPAWHAHGPDFIRACCHLSHRVNAVVESVRPKHLRFVQPYYPGFSEVHFMEALGNELERSGSIRAILTEPAPQAFTKLWNEAVA